jgi:peptidoglycan/xylan/chitin deacetylase (PgdA/CDA1 family)
MSVTPADFEELLRHKLEAGYEPMTLTESQAPDRPDRALVVTFDDAYVSTFTHAAPILDRLGIPATLFVPTSYIGQSEPMAWPGIDRWMGGPHEEELKPIDWDQVRSLAERGWEIGSHSHVHPHLTQLSEDELDREFAVSRKTIEEQLGTPCLTVAYPYGDTDERVAAAASRAGYELGVAMPSRWTRDHNPMLLPRVGVYHRQGRLKLALKTSATVRRLRSLLRR